MHHMSLWNGQYKNDNCQTICTYETCTPIITLDWSHSVAIFEPRIAEQCHQTFRNVTFIRKQAKRRKYPLTYECDGNYVTEMSYHTRLASFCLSTYICYVYESSVSLVSNTGLKHGCGAIIIYMFVYYQKHNSNWKSVAIMCWEDPIPSMYYIRLSILNPITHIACYITFCTNSLDNFLELPWSPKTFLKKITMLWFL